MMHKLWFLGCWMVFCFIPNWGFSQDFPELKEVVKHFYSNYQLEEGATFHLKFEKRPGGWFVGKQEIGAETWPSGCLWSAQTDMFQSLNFKKAPTPPAPELLQQLIAKHQDSNYDLQKFFGYPGWCADVISHHKETPARTDSSLYALARAYSTCASDLLHNNYGLSEPTTRFPLRLQKGKMTQPQVEEYTNLKMEALKIFTQLAEENPKFVTTVGFIALKRDQEFVATYQELLIYSSGTTAEKFLPKEIFDASTRSWAKQTLQSMASNAIYLAWGDNDFYPLLYLQAKEKIRLDVAIVSLPLLQNIDYLKFVQTELPYGQWPHQNWENLAGANKEVFLRSGTKTIALKSLNDTIARTAPLENLNSVKDYLRFDFQNLLFAVGGDTLKIKIDAPFFTRSQLAVYSALQADQWQHTWYFSGFSSPQWLEQCAGFLVFYGFLYELRPNLQPAPYVDGFSYVDVELYTKLLYRHLKESAEWSKKEGFNGKLRQIRYAGVLAAAKHIQAKKIAEATTLLEELAYRWPHDSLPYDWTLWQLVEVYLQLGDTMKALENAATITQELKQQRPKSPRALQLAALQFDLYRKELERLAQQYNLPELAVF